MTVLMMCGSTTANEAPKTTSSTKAFEISRYGSIQYLPPDCGGKVCVSIGVPYLYTGYPSENLESDIIAALQSAGLSFNPEKYTDVSPECSAKVDELGDTAVRRFWTDYVMIDDDLLHRLSINKEELGVELETQYRYRIRVYGCYYVAKDDPAFFDSIVIDVCDRRLPLNTPSSMITRVTVMMSANVQYRGSKSVYTDITNEDFRTKSVLDKLADFVDKNSDSEPRTAQITTTSSCS